MGGNPYIGQLLLVGFSFNPANWAYCNGQLIPISQNEPLYSLLGTTFGGDGVNTFGLPDLRGRVPVHFGTGAGIGTYTMGEAAGSESVTVTVPTYPKHNHNFLVSNQNSNTQQPPGNVIGGALAFSTSGSAGQLAVATIGPSAGASLGHENRQPFLAMNWIISLYGIYPTQS